MEQNTPKLPFPLWMIALDLIGVFILALGAYLLSNHNPTLVPEHLRFEHDALIWIVFGFLLTVPMLRHIINAAKAINKAQKNPAKSEPTVR